MAGMLYAFDSLAALLSVCRILSEGGYGRPTAVYAGEEGEWYLFLDEKGKRTEGRLDELSFIEEYGCRRRPFDAVTLREHATYIADVGTLAPLG